MASTSAQGIFSAFLSYIYGLCEYVVKHYGYSNADAHQIMTI